MLNARSLRLTHALRVGIDVVEVAKVQKVFAEESGRREAVFTPREIRSAMRERRPLRRLAGCFAAKEATFKVLETGLSGKMEWRDIEVQEEVSGKPRLCLRGESARLARLMRVTEHSLSLSYAGDHAVALVLFVVAE